MYSRDDNRYAVALRSRVYQRAVIKTFALLLFAAAIVFGAAFLMQSCRAHELVSLPASNTGGAVQSEYSSTPVEQWQQGVMPTLYQKDPQWSNYPYAASAFSESGCGPACLAMVYIYLTGDRSQTPATIAAMATSSGCASPEGTAWLFMTAGAHALGISAQELPADRGLVAMHLSADNPIIVVLGPGDFTSEGHFIVLTGIDANNQVTVRDPNSVERTNQTWDLDSLMIQIRNLWVYHQ